jgi:hypothetical protein
MQKGDLKGALAQLQMVQSLVTKDPANLSKINDEIKALEEQINQQTSQTQGTQNTQSALNTPPAETLPAQNPPVKIPAPQAKIVPTATPTGSPKITPPATTEGGNPLPPDTVTPKP